MIAFTMLASFLRATFEMRSPLACLLWVYEGDFFVAGWTQLHLT
jgi:hypothetical protein